MYVSNQCLDLSNETPFNLKFLLPFCSFFTVTLCRKSIPIPLYPYSYHIIALVILFSIFLSAGFSIFSGLSLFAFYKPYGKISEMAQNLTIFSVLTFSPGIIYFQKPSQDTEFAL